jgi:hypothetical protein
MPLSFMLPKGAISPAGFRRDDALVDADDAVFEGLGDAPDAAGVPAVEIGGEPLPFPPPRAGEGMGGGVVGRLTRKNRLRPSRAPCSACFIRSRSGIANSFKNKWPCSRRADLAKIRCDYGDFTVAKYTITSGSAGWRQSHGCNPAPRLPSSQMPNRSCTR